jgi:hypothetical protein
MEIKKILIESRIYETPAPALECLDDLKMDGNRLLRNISNRKVAIMLNFEEM